jgi:acyl-[acyl carrier protein]--UDP-N-acetylglucosamine O-acyltransferase
VIGPNVRIGDHATILPHVVLYPGVSVGDHFFAHAHAVVREGCVLGDHVTLENGAIVGSDGFGFAKDSQGSWHKIPQSGPVRIGNHVDVQANACIDRATVGATEIADGAKIDNLVQIGHGSKVGKNTLVCAQAGLAGSSVVGANAILAGQAGVAGHCTLGDGVILTAQSGVSHDVPAGKMLSGSPAFENRTWLRATPSSSACPRYCAASINWRKPAHETALESIEDSPVTNGKEERQLKKIENKDLDRDCAPIMQSCCARHQWLQKLLGRCQIENQTGQPIHELEVDYPTASFGTNTLAPGAAMHYRFQIRGSGPVKVEYTCRMEKPLMLKLLR